jgi:hypothetical protein
MAEQDTLFYEILDALKAGGGPICRLGNRAATRYIDTLNYEGVNDPVLRESLRKARGLCNRHAWEWTHMRGSPLGVAIVYQNLVRDLAEVLASGAPLAEQGRGRRARGPLAPAAGCPACKAADDAGVRYTMTLLKYLARPEIDEVYVNSGGLCLLHLRAAVNMAEVGQIAKLANSQAAVYRGLDEQLGEFIRKHDYRFAGEPMEAEKDAWTRAVAAIAGQAEDVR